MTEKTRKKNFDIYLPATAEKEAQLVETIEVEVYDRSGEEFLTTESNELIEQTRARHLGLMHGSDIKRLRVKLNLTQDQLSDLLRCGKKSLSRWESGRSYPSQLVNTFLRLLDEDFLSPASLNAVKGPRHTVATSTFFRQRDRQVTNYDFTSVTPSPAAVKDLLSKTRQTSLCQ